MNYKLLAANGVNATHSNYLGNRSGERKKNVGSFVYVESHEINATRMKKVLMP